MTLEWIILAEGFGTASNGAVTAIGVNQQVIVASSFPVTTKRGIMAHIANDGETSLYGKELEVRVTVCDPEDKPIWVQTSPARMNPAPPWPGLPGGVDVFVEIPLHLSEYGTYKITLSVKPPEGDTVTGTVSFYVKESPAVPVDTR